MAIPSRNNRVFLNLPFDREYEPVLVACVSALSALGFRARTVLEIPPDGADRIDRILRLVEDCDASVHDLSCVKRTKGKYPRFNMPFELGLAVAIARRDHPRRKFFVMEREHHRLEWTLNDVNGCDPLVYNEPERIVPLLAAHFVGPAPRPTPGQLVANASFRM